MKKIIKKILNEDMEGFLNPESGDWEWTKGEITLPSYDQRRKISFDDFLMECLGFQSRENYEDWRYDPWSYEPREGDPDIDWGESEDYIIRETILWNFENDKWKLFDENITEADIWDSVRETQFIFKNKQEDSYWGFSYTQYYEEEEFGDNLVEVFRYATKIVFR
jgi:hypothetical protein